LIKSSEFNATLENININYFNLKQELFIRNSILEMFNKKYCDANYKAFAEHPRLNGSRVDLSIVDKADSKKPFLVELKYQFPKDVIGQYEKIIETDFNKKNIGKQTDLFILIVALWEISEKDQFDKNLEIDSNLSRYQFKKRDKNGSDWEQILLGNFKDINEGVLLPKITHKIYKPYPVDYNIYMLERLEKS
jgi:hypothetical protein